MSLLKAIMDAETVGKQLSPKLEVSKNYKNWISYKDWRRCTECANNHGKIWEIDAMPYPQPPAHFNCRCFITEIPAIVVGTATVEGLYGADWHLKYEEKLPDYYIKKSEALELGWSGGKAPSDFFPNKMITGGIYHNNNKHLPDQRGRIWYEADINYEKGKRNSQRILWSNDGLIFVTYDHYHTFIEVIQEDN